MKSDLIKIAKNTLAQIIGKLVTMVTMVVTTILITRALGVSGYGDFTKALALVTIFYTISDFGFNAIIIKKFTENKNQMKRIIANLLGIRITLAAFLILLILIITPFLPFNIANQQGFSPSVKFAIIIGSFLVLTQSLYTSFNAIFQFKLRYDQSVIASTLGSLVSVMLIIVLTRMNPSIFSVIFAYLIGGLTTVLTASILAKRLIKFSWPIFDFGFLKSIFKQVLPLGLTLIFNLIYFRIDTLILAGSRPTNEVAYYGISYRVFETTLVLPIFLINSIYPLMVKTVQSKRQKFNQLIKLAFNFLLIASVFIALIIFLLSDLILLILGGAEFVQAKYSLKILAASIPFFYFSALTMWLLIAFKRQNLLVYIYGFGAILNVAANLIFIPQFGYLAAAVITGVSELIILALSVLFLYHHLKIRPQVEEVEIYES